MIDLVKLKIIAGDGGDGRISLLHERSRPKGGPDGGDGGRGGSIIFKANKNLNTLKHFAGIKEIVAKKGESGGKNKRHGADGEDVIVEVPLGTVIWLEAENEPSKNRRKRYEQSLAEFDFDSDVSEISQDSVVNETNIISTPFRFDILFSRNDVTFQKYFQDFSGSRNGERLYELDEQKAVDPNQELVNNKQFTAFDKILDNAGHIATAVKIAELKEDQQQLVLCQGGLGGRGNRAFRSSTNQTPREAEYGTFGEKKTVILELRLLADLGLVGLPNAGKSTLLSRLTKAKPKIADYPFTTLEPQLGVLSSKDGKKELVVADIPGLIEGASQGKGLGDRFLRHIENCQSLMYVLFLEEEVVFDDSISLQKKAQQLLQQYQLLQNELGEYHPELLEKSSAITVNKLDIYPQELVKAIEQKFLDENIKVILFSGVTGEGLDEIKDRIFSL